MSTDGNHCSFVLLAEFDILEGAQLKYQFPQPLGVDEGVLAMSMLPDGAETQLDDWTIFFLNQTPFNTISPVLALDSPALKTRSLPEDESGDGETTPDLLCVLNLVRTKHDRTLDRGARVLALAICTRHPFIQIFKPVLLMALDDYLSYPSQDCLARLFDAVNSMDLSGAPTLSRHEKMLMRSSDRKDLFLEKLSQQQQQSTFSLQVPIQNHRHTNSSESYSSFEEGIMMRNIEKDRIADENRTEAANVTRSRERADTVESVTPSLTPPSDSSFSLGGSAVWVGDESGLDLSIGDAPTITRKRRSTDTSSSTSHLKTTQNHKPPALEATRSGVNKDPHFYHTNVSYQDHILPIKMPLYTFPEEVGDYSLITLVRTFSSAHLVSGPQHPHLHTSGIQTHPVIVLFNALVTGKRIIFLGHKRPAGEVSTFVLSACALGSGCGVILRGFVERAFPYANLENRDEWEAVPAYIAGVTNPIFESSRAWDLLLDIGSGTVTVAKDIHVNYPVQPIIGFSGPLLSRSGTIKAESSAGDEEGKRDGIKGDYGAKSDNNADNIFIEDIKSSIEYHYGEGLVRLRFTEYVARFVRLASRYEEEATGSTLFGYPSAPFIEATSLRAPQLGSGMLFNDDSIGMKELTFNAQRIEAWRKTTSYKYCVHDFIKAQAANPIKGFDVIHQLFRLRHGKNVSDPEMAAIMRALADNVKTYEQVVELLSYIVPHSGGLLVVAFGLFHPQESVRDMTVELFNQIRVYPVGAIVLQTLNHFHRYAYVRLAHIKEKQLQPQQTSSQQSHAPPSISSRTYSNNSSVGVYA